MALKSLVTYFTPNLLPVKAQVVDNAGTHVLVKVTGRTHRLYRKGLLMLVPRTSLELR